MKSITNKVSRVSWPLGILTALCLILVPIFLQARELGKHEVRAAVETWVRYVTADARPDAVIERMEPHKVKGKTVAYIAHLMGGGFCLCGADDLVLPVYLYGPQGEYDPQNPNYQYILWEIETRLKYLREGLKKGVPKVLQYQKTLSERAAFWQDLLAGLTPKRLERPEGVLVEPDSMSLNLTSRWHQDSPYNDQCPVLTPPDEHTLVGCSATAMAQIMYYWKWPNTGQGWNDVYYKYRWRTNWDEEPLAVNPDTSRFPGVWHGRLEWTPASGGKLRMIGYWDKSVYGPAKNISQDADYRVALENLWNRLTPDSTYCWAFFGATTYNWGILEDIHTDPPDAGDVEVAKLCYHAGIANQQKYGIWVTMGGIGGIGPGLADYFRYDPDAEHGPRNIDTMTDEIQWLRPILIQGCTKTGSCHFWVVFGYNKGTDPIQFKINMGQGGGPGWYSCDNVPGDYNLDQYHVTHIAPLNVVKFVGDDDPGDGSPSDPYEDIEEAIAEAPDDATLIFKAGSDNTFSAPTLTINRLLTLKGYDVTIRKK